MNSRFVEQILRQQQEIERLYKPVFDEIEQSKRYFQSATVNISPAAAAVERTQQKIQAAVKRISANLPIADVSRLVEQTQSALAALHRLPPRTREALNALAARGWYLNPTWPVSATGAFKNAIDAGAESAVDAALSEHFDGELRAIQQTVTSRYPKRSRILSCAFDAHERGEYELSVPVLIAQADGICWEATTFQLFKSRDKRPEIAQYVDRYAADTYRGALLAPLTEIHPISASASARPPGFDGLNRHQVLHGESVDYGTEVNSLKAVSLLNYLAWVLHLA